MPAATIPFTQAYEAVKNIVGDRRVDSATENFFKDLVNLVYTRAMPQVLEWDLLKKEWTPISVVAQYETGTATVTSGDATVTISTGTLPTTLGDLWKFKLLSGTDVDDVYEVSSRTDATNFELNRTFYGTTASTLTYILYQDMIELPEDFDRFTTNPRVWYRDGGTTQFFDFREDGLFLGMQHSDTGTPREMRIHPNKSTNSRYRLQFNTGWDEAKLIYGEHIYLLSDLSEYTSGTLAVTNSSQTFTGSSTLWSTNASVGDYIRVDSDQPPRWYKITAVGSDTGITASVDGDAATGYRGATASGVSYTISKSMSGISALWQNAIIYGAAALAASHQDDNDGFTRWQSMSGIPVGVLTSLARAENRVNYGNQRIRSVYQTKPYMRR